MIGYKMIIKSSTLNKDAYFVFCFFDGLYYYKYNKEQKLETKYNYCLRIDRGVQTINNYCFIPIDLLIKIL